MMPNARSRQAALAAAALAAFAPALHAQAGVASPDGRTVVSVAVRDGQLFYSVDRDGRALLLPSMLGMAFRGAPPLRDSLRLMDFTRQTHDEWWVQPWGEVARVREHYHELDVGVEETRRPGRRFRLRIRAFDDGIGFR